MKRSRLKLFKTTSLTISLIGVILILITIGVVAYVTVSDVSNSVSTTVNSGSSYDDLNQLKSQFNNVSVKYLSIESKLTVSNTEITAEDQSRKSTYNEGKLKLNEANQTLLSIENDIRNGKSNDEVQPKIDEVKSDLKEVEGIYANLTA